MRVYVIRHGESETNVNKRWTGWLDVNLTQKGVNDAKRAGELIKGVHFDKVFASDLTRAVETAKNAIPDCEIQKSPLFREVNVGNIAGKPLNILTDEQRERIAKEGYIGFGGEANTVFKERVEKAKNMLKTLECENAAVFTHKGWLLAMLDSVIGIRMPRKNICCDNCTVAVFEYINENWRLNSWINLL